MSFGPTPYFNDPIPLFSVCHCFWKEVTNPHQRSLIWNASFFPLATCKIFFNFHFHHVIFLLLTIFWVSSICIFIFFIKISSHCFPSSTPYPPATFWKANYTYLWFPQHYVHFWAVLCSVFLSSGWISFHWSVMGTDHFLCKFSTCYLVYQ